MVLRPLDLLQSRISKWKYVRWTYTYVGSTWGRIVDILMESKCMNPIIFIDELDKVSRTENGR